MKRFFFIATVISLIALLFYGSLAGTPETLFTFRLTRLTAAFCVGGALALAGTLTQAIFRNALATPYTLGVSGGAAVGAALTILCGAGNLTAMLPVGAFAGGIITFALVLFIGRFGRRGATELLLAGVIAGTLFSGILLYLVSRANTLQLAGISWWTLGDLSGIDPGGVAAVAGAGILTLFLAKFFANDLNAMAFGDEGAHFLGVAVTRVRLLLLTMTTLLVALTVSFCGIIGFVGLVVPHIVRKISGSSMRHLPFDAFLCGALFLMLCDRLGHLLDPVRQLPPGVVTSLLGGALFLVVLYRSGGYEK